MDYPSEDATVSTTTPSSPKSKRLRNQSPNESRRVLSQEELKAWWPFTRLDPRRFPKQPSVYETAEPAPF
jgi:hypothetical protein